MLRMPRLASSLGALLLAALLGAQGCTKVILQKPKFVTEADKKQEEWLAEQRGKKGKAAEAPAPAPKPEAAPAAASTQEGGEAAAAAGPTELTSILLDMFDKDVDFDTGYERTLTIQRLSTTAISPEELQKIGRSIEAQIVGLVHRAYLKKSLGGPTSAAAAPAGEGAAAAAAPKPASGLRLYPADAATDGPRVTVKVEVPKGSRTVKAYAQATTPLIARMGLFGGTKAGGPAKVELPTDPKDVPIAGEDVMHAYPFKVSISVPKQELLPVFSSGQFDELLRIVAAIEAGLKAQDSGATEKPAFELVDGLMKGASVTVERPVSASVGENKTALRFLAERIGDSFGERVLGALIKDYKQEVSLPNQPFLDVLASPRNRSLMRTLVQETVRLDPAFYNTVTREADTTVLTGKTGFSVQLHHGDAQTAKALLYYIGDDYLRLLVTRGDFKKFYRSPVLYKKEITWIGKIVAPPDADPCNLSLAVVFGKKAQFLPGAGNKLGILHPTVQHEEIARRAVYDALVLTQSKWKDEKAKDHGLRIARDVSATREFARKIAKEHKVPGGVFARFSFTPRPKDQSIDLASFNGGFVRLHATPSGTGAEWVRPVTKPVDDNVLQIDLLVDPTKAQRGATIKIPLLELEAEKKEGEGILRVRCEDTVLTCDPLPGDKPGDEVPLVVLIQVEELKGSLDHIRQLLATENPAAWNITKTVKEGGKDYRRRQSYQLDGKIVMLDVAYIPLCDGKILRIGGEWEVRVPISGAEKTVVAFLPIRLQEAPWGTAEQIGLALESVSVAAEDHLVAAGKAKGYFDGDEGPGRFRKQFRLEILQKFPSFLPDTPEPKDAKSGLRDKIRGWAIPPGKETRWGVTTRTAAKVRLLMQNVLGGGTIDVEGKEKGVEIVLTQRVKEDFGDYGKFLLECNSLCKRAVTVLLSEGNLGDAFIRLEKKGGRWKAVAAERMYFSEDPETDELMLGVQQEVGDEFRVPRVFFVRIDNKYLFYCTDSSLEKNRTRAGGRVPTWPRHLREPK